MVRLSLVASYLYVSYRVVRVVDCLVPDDDVLSVVCRVVKVEESDGFVDSCRLRVVVLVVLCEVVGLESVEEDTDASYAEVLLYDDEACVREVLYLFEVFYRSVCRSAELQ